MRPSVPIVQGMMTMASSGLEPLAKGAFMLFKPWVLTPSRQAQAAGQFPGQHDLRVVAQHHVDLVLARVELVKQALRIASRRWLP